jgi:hypothetical protein
MGWTRLPITPKASQGVVRHPRWPKRGGRRPHYFYKLFFGGGGGGLVFNCFILFYF